MVHLGEEGGDVRGGNLRLSDNLIEEEIERGRVRDAP